MAGEGPRSDGVPRAIGTHGERPSVMPAPPRTSRPLVDFDKTVPNRRHP